jgi:catechol 2,3-dioxygenase-like lactoylglutathione lyase family enzyme
MRLNQVTVPSTDIDRSVAFYLRLGLEQIVSSPHYSRFVVPGNSATFSVEKVDAVTPGVTVYFECDDLDDRVAELARRGIMFEHGPRDESWLWREARCSDPDGNRICLYRAGENRLNPPWALRPPRRQI